uniref:Uncharacterized protein n=1 Tax=Hippocampus comes TaxID=109280 RepID=A0A3Q2YIX3_HIPCM
MVTGILLSLLLMLGGFDTETASIPKVSRKSSCCGKNPQRCNQRWHTGRMQTHNQKKSEALRSLDLEHFKIDVVPTTSETSLPAAVGPHPPDAKPLHLLKNMPQRFGRQSVPDDAKSTPNKPQRFGRSWEVIPKCAKCVGEILNPEACQRWTRNNLCWRLLRTLSRENLKAIHHIFLLKKNLRFETGK